MRSTILSLLALTSLVFAAKLPRDVLRRQTPSGKFQFLGTNIAGFDFGCTTAGTCDISKAVPPLSNLKGPDGAGQMVHFATDNKFNLFRLPVAWQFLVNNQLGGALDATKVGQYDQLMQACLDTGATCVIDIHNYARYNGKVIGTGGGGPTNDQFASLWTQLATKYGANPKIVFGLINEPHDLPSLPQWADTVQAAVTAVRQVAPDSMILLPGSSFASAEKLPTEAGPTLLKVANPDGSKTGLVFDVHKYLDSDNSGTHRECTTDNIANAFQPLATWLRDNQRQALLTETGGGNTPSCQTKFCAQLDFMKKNNDVFLGVVGWSAGSFDAKYELTETPTKQGNTWVDTPLVKSCLVN